MSGRQMSGRGRRGGSRACDDDVPSCVPLRSSPVSIPAAYVQITDREIRAARMNVYERPSVHVA